MRGARFLLLCWIAGCATTLQVTAADLAARADRDLFEAQRDLAGKLVVVHGTVRGTTLVPRQKVQLNGVGVGYEATASVVRDNLPLVLLDPGSVLDAGFSNHPRLQLITIGRPACL